MISFLYEAVTRWRRHYIEPRALARPVISIGNIASGGRGKTPMTALVAQTLLVADERPAVLSRGYARARHVDAPVIVRDARSVRAPIEESGDEPFMLAESLDGAIVLVHPDRAIAGRVAEQLGATVHVLDDGFQHLRVARDVDIVMMEPGDLGSTVMPAGRLREPIDALDHAHAIVMLGANGMERDEAARALQIPGVRLFTGSRRVAAPAADLAGAPAFLVSGLADNAQFAHGVKAAGWTTCGHATFRDHHRYSRGEAERVSGEARAAGAAFVLTTAKDAVRLRGVWPGDVPLQVAALSLDLDDREGFDTWLLERVRTARASRAERAYRRGVYGARRAS